MFFLKQKTAYEMLRSLVGSEMCIRDSSRLVSQFARQEGIDVFRARGIIFTGFQVCLCSAMNHQVGANLLQQDGNDIKILQVFMDTVSYTHLTMPTIYSV